MVGDDHEGGGGGAFGAHASELLGEGLACQASEGRVVVDNGGPDGADACGLVDEGDADDVLVRRDDRRGGHVGPRPSPRRLVESIDQAGQGRVAVRAAPDGEGVFDLLQGDHVGPERVDGGDDLGLLVGEGLAGEGSAHPALLRRHEGTRAVRVSRAPGLVDPQVGEVVQDVEGGDARVPSDRGRPRALPGDGDGRSVGVPGDHGGRLEDEGAVPGLEHHGPIEGHVVADARGSAVCQVRVGNLRRRALEQVRVRAVVEGDHPRGVGGLVVAGRLAGSDHVGRRPQRLRARRERQGSILVRLVVVGDRPRALGCEQHGLVGLRLTIRGDAGDRSGGHGLAPVNLRESGGGQLREALRIARRSRRRELPDRSGDAHARPRGRDLAVLPRVDEERVRTRAPLVPRTARARGLDRVSVQGGAQPRFGGRVGGGHDADRGDGGSHHRGVIPRTHGLNIRDGRIDEAGAGFPRLRGIAGLGRLSAFRSTRPERLRLVGVRGAFRDCLLRIRLGRRRSASRRRLRRSGLRGI